MDPSAPHAHQQVLRWLVTSRREPYALSVVLLRDYLDAGPRRALAMARHALADRIERRLPQLGIPALVVRGTDDAIVSQRWAETVAELAGAELVLIDGARALNFSHPAELAAVLRPFFENANGG
jgi:pimeloyl-ACP methyl ester carboxylesterase